jgi:hypothetical protein
MSSKYQIILKKAVKELGSCDSECPICYRMYGSDCEKEILVRCTHYCCSDCCVKLSKPEKVFCPICRRDWTLWIHSKFNKDATFRFNFAKCLSEITMIPDDEEMFTMKSKKSNEYYFIFLEEGDDDKYAMVSTKLFYTDIINFMPYYKIMLNYTFDKNLFSFCDASRSFDFYIKMTQFRDLTL